MSQHPPIAAGGPDLADSGWSPPTCEPLIVAEDVTKAFDSSVVLAGGDLTVQQGNMLGLGRCGAGKSTLVRILSTLLRPDDERAPTGGVDVVRDAQRVRAQQTAGPAAAVGSGALELGVPSADPERLRGLLADLGSGEPVADTRLPRITLPTGEPTETLLTARGGSERLASRSTISTCGSRRWTTGSLSLTGSREARAGDTSIGAQAGRSLAHPTKAYR